jgi:hypothetical protein
LKRANALSQLGSGAAWERHGIKRTLLRIPGARKAALAQLPAHISGQLGQVPQRVFRINAIIFGRRIRARSY